MVGLAPRDTGQQGPHSLGRERGRLHFLITAELHFYGGGIDSYILVACRPCLVACRCGFVPLMLPFKELLEQVPKGLGSSKAQVQGLPAPRHSLDNGWSVRIAWDG